MTLVSVRVSFYSLSTSEHNVKTFKSISTQVKEAVKHQGNDTGNTSEIADDHLSERLNHDVSNKHPSSSTRNRVSNDVFEGDTKYTSDTFITDPFPSSTNDCIESIDVDLKTLDLLFRQQS